MHRWFQSLNQEFVDLAGVKENLFWTTYMGTGEPASGDTDPFAEAETALQAFISDPDRLHDVRKKLNEAKSAPKPDAALVHGLEGWRAFFESNVVESPEAKQLGDGLIEEDGALFKKRKKLAMHYTDAAGAKVEASSPVLSTNLVGNASEPVRKSSYDALRGLERWAVDNGFVEMVKHRNEFARAGGYRNYFDWKVNRGEQMTPEALFAILDEFEEQTRAAQERGFAALAKEHGNDALAPHNVKYATRGDLTQKMDPYFSFGQGLRRWVESFGRLGVTFRDATLTLDLLDRKGKYENGFMHAPSVSWFRDGKWQPATINFTSTANPGQVGSGRKGLQTLFHEGGHAAHFANVTQNAPCFSQEFPPTTMSYAETQSMFMDSLLEDADWLSRYATNAEGEPMPAALIREDIAARQPFEAFSKRSMLVVPYFEWALYSLADADLTGDAILDLARTWERKIFGLDGSPRPLLSIPHLLDRESACSYHGYLLANMAVYQTRSFLSRDGGTLTDNPAIGPLLVETYWGPGNSVHRDETLSNLTGEGLSGRFLAEHCNRSVEDAWAEADALIAGANARAQPPVQPLQASIRVVHGLEVIADNSESDTRMFEDFERWVAKKY